MRIKKSQTKSGKGSKKKKKKYWNVKEGGKRGERGAKS
jgi:hypothetical protein